MLFVISTTKTRRLKLEKSAKKKLKIDSMVKKIVEM